jgi:UDP-2,3-diacylglucosamine pyrophosphatase LpxH
MTICDRHGKPARSHYQVVERVDYAQMATQQRTIDFAHAALAELLAERRIDRLVAGNHHLPKIRRAFRG